MILKPLIRKSFEGKCQKSVILSHMPSNNWWFFKQTSKSLFRESVCSAHYYQMSVQMKVVPKDREWQVVEIWYSSDCVLECFNSNRQVWSTKMLSTHWIGDPKIILHHSIKCEKLILKDF